MKEANENHTWAQAIPEAQGLYDPEYEKDSCGVGFIVQIKGKPSHKILSDARGILCNMTHRGATGADARDGDGAGVMTAIPHQFFKRETAALGFHLPPFGQYAAGNLFFNPQKHEEQKRAFESIARTLNLKVLGWRKVPVDNTILGPVSKSKEPHISQPFVVMDTPRFEYRAFKRQLYLLRKTAVREIRLENWFYVCSLSSKNITYKGQLTPVQVYQYFLDLGNYRYETHFALVHSRFSTNTFPSWDRAQPMRFCAHNGEINTLRGNKNWMRSREGIMKSELFKHELEKLYPIIEESGSDSAAFDNVLELLVINGVLSLPEAMMIMVPEAWQSNPFMDPKKRAFYEWASCLMEPWDGPALFTFSDGRYCGACLDRNGLRPCRYYILDDDRMICASEVGTMFIDPKTVVKKGRLQPGKMLLVDTLEGHIVDDAALKENVSTRENFQDWIAKQVISMDKVHDLHQQSPDFIPYSVNEVPIKKDPRVQIFGFTLEQMNKLILPMVKDAKEALGSMGNDAPLACLSKQPRCIYEYFRQLFAQVTNPPIDPIREEIVMSLECCIGPEGNMLEMNESQCRKLLLKTPILDNEELRSIQNLAKYIPDWRVSTINITFPRSEGIQGYRRALDRICHLVSKAIQDGVKVVVLSDADANKDLVPTHALIAVGAVHQYLVQHKQRSRIALIVETGEAREVHHHCVLLGYGADAICPYLAIDTMFKLHKEGLLDSVKSAQEILTNYKKASNNGILKVMSKMGISTLQSYKGAQIFEALGVGEEVISRCFKGTSSRIKGVTFETFAEDVLKLHELAYPTRETVSISAIPEIGEYHWRRGGEMHLNEPSAIGNLQDAVRNKNVKAYQLYAQDCFAQIRHCTLRGLMDFNFDHAKAIPIDEVEPWTNIVKRFVTGAMSYGSISYESHTALAAAMNQLGGKSNTGEGGEDPIRSHQLFNGENHRSAIKQVASGRFGVTSFYLSDADELEIKMAQGAKHGEGGELPGHKVSGDIAKTRKSTAGVGLISPPPHHDIYSIEDLKQLIYDLKTANPRSRVSVKLVSEVGVGIVASGVAKAKADHILISGHDGGTGASRWTGIKYAGLPWELGLAETHQTLVLNDLRGRVILQTDGQIKTGRDVAIACLLGAEEWGFATTPLIALGCIMMRKCHLNTCPVGIATQDPELRKKFEGQPEHVVNFFYYIAEEMRAIMAKLGFRTINEMVGRTDRLKVDIPVDNPKANLLDLSPILIPAFELRPGAATYCTRKQDHKLHVRLDNKLIAESEMAIKNKTPVQIESEILNTDRTLGSTLSYHISQTHGEEGLPENTIKVKLNGSAGQSFGAFLASGVTLTLEGDANDYVGKGLSGGKLVIYPPRSAQFESEENIIIGNVCLYGATSGHAFFRGIAAERFAVRNSGAIAVVEGVGDHGCEYMTGGRVVILGSVGRNFAAGMSGGIAYVLDAIKDFKDKCNMEMVEFEVIDAQEARFLKSLIHEHQHLTQSEVARRILSNFDQYLKQFVKVMPTDYKRAVNQAQSTEQKTTDQPSDEQVQKTEITTTTQEQQRLLADIEDISTEDEITDNRIKVIDKVRGFVKYKRRGDRYRDPAARVKDWEEINHRLTSTQLKIQAARCMDCGIPFCQSGNGCPIGNIIPKWNELVHLGQWKDALDRLMLTNNFPEFTGRVCPAPCEGACVLGINAPPVSIKSIECAIIDKGFEQGWIYPQPPSKRTGKTIAVIGSGPAGLAAADQLNKAGHLVTVYDRNDRAGGLLMYGIPNMKLDKKIVQRRIDLLAEEGIEFKLKTFVGQDITFHELQSQYDAILMATGATWPRDLNIPNRQLNGIHFAMEYLQKNTQSLLDSQFSDESTYINPRGKHVVVIGGGDTGCDCIGTSIRHGAASITNFELLPQPPESRARDNPWPQFPKVFKMDYGHSEVQVQYQKDPREYSILTQEFVADEANQQVTGIKTVRVEWCKNEQGKWQMKTVPNSEQVFPADLIFLSMGFLGPEQMIIKQAQLRTDRNSNILTIASSMHIQNGTNNNSASSSNQGENQGPEIVVQRGMYSTNIIGVFAAGDCRRGQSLIVWAINEGRQAAREIDQYLMGSTYLPVCGGIVEPPLTNPPLSDHLEIEVKAF